MHALQSITALALGSLLLVGCKSDPVYVMPPSGLQAGGPNADPDVPATTSFTLPIRLEEMTEASSRAALAMELGIEVPYITIDDLDISMEWTIHNNGDAPANARILLNGANEYFAYIPASFVVDPDDEPTPPPLAGDIPLQVPAQGSLNGVFREDQLREAAIDLEQITRGAVNPFAAMLESHEALQEIAVENGNAIPIEDVAQLIRFDITLLSDQAITLEYAIRLRSSRSPNLVHKEGLSAPEGELTVFAPADFVPPPPVAP